MKNIITYLALTIFLNTIAFAQEEGDLKKKDVKESTRKISKHKKRGHKLKFRNLDTDNDREISLKEFIDFNRHRLEKRFDHIDKNQDGIIDRKEFLRMQKEMRKEDNKKRKRRRD